MISLGLKQEMFIILKKIGIYSKLGQHLSVGEIISERNELAFSKRNNVHCMDNKNVFVFKLFMVFEKKTGQNKDQCFGNFLQLY